MSTNLAKRSWLQRLIEREKAPETHLIKTAAFWLSIAPPLLIGLALVLAACINEGRDFDFSTTGYNIFLNDFKLPVAVMGLAIPLGALAAAIHRSVQTSRQIKEQYSQNVFSNHLAHREYFFKFISDFDPFSGISVNHAKAYELLFPKAVDGELSPNLAAAQTVLGEIYGLQEDLNISLRHHFKEDNLIDDKNKIFASIEDYQYFIYSALDKYEKTDDLLISIGLFNLIGQKVNESFSIATGITKCLNFHRFYVNEHEGTNIDKLEDLMISNLNIIEELKPKHHLYRELRLSIDEYFDNELNFRDLTQESAAQFASRLSVIPNNHKIEAGSPIFKDVISRYFNIDEQKLLERYSPASIQISLNQD